MVVIFIDVYSSRGFEARETQNKDNCLCIIESENWNGVLNIQGVGVRVRGSEGGGDLVRILELNPQLGNQIYQ